MSEIVWLTTELVVAVHGEQLARFGGPDGIRDIGMLESALGRAVNRHLYESDVDLAGLAAAYAFGIARNHPFVDGNKRAALLSLIVFLGLNGVDFVVPETEAVVAIQSLAAGELSEAALAAWIRDRIAGIGR